MISRPTRDCDILHPELSVRILAAARDFAEQQRIEGDALAIDWLNNGPMSLGQSLPEIANRLLLRGMRSRCELLDVVTCSARNSSLCAIVERIFWIASPLRQLLEEIRTLSGWLEAQDANPGWPAHVRTTLADLSQRLGHGL